MKSKILLLTVLMIFSLSGCDWIRKQLGKPTSEELAAMQAEMQRAKEQRMADSLKQVAAMDSIRLAEQAQLPYISELTHKYYVILGSFKKDFNAENMVANLKKAGYSPVRIALKNGFDMVAAVGCDTYSEASDEILKIEDNDLCPYDVWVYSVEQNLHE